jgi:hypothetical protein
VARVNPLRDVYGKTLPAIEGSHGDVFPGSVLALVGCFVEATKARFKDDNAVDLPWRWKSDPTPTADEDNTGDAPRTLYIASSYAEDPDARDPRPAIYVGNGGMQILNLWIGALGGYDVPTATKVHIVHAMTEIRFECVSNRRGESMQLAQTMVDYLTGSKDDFREAFCLHDVSPVQMGETLVQRRAAESVESYSTMIGMQVQGKLLYLRWPIAPVLQEIVMRLSASPEGFEAAATEIALRSKRVK